MIDGNRLLTNLHALREFGRQGDGVVRRCLDAADMAARHWLVERMRDAGLDAGIDGVANVLGVSPNPGPALLLGSHSDTQPTGGWLDGALGVVCGIEVAQTLHDHPATRELAIDVASWADEESHYLGLMGSRSFCGLLDEAEIDIARNDEDHPLRTALAEQGLAKRPRFRLDSTRYTGYLEAHIEQGPWLEQAQRRIGVVTSIVGMRDLTIRVHGQQNHAGTTPMHLRQDAAQTLFAFNAQINEAFAQLGGGDAVWTLGQLRVTPFARSIVPGMAEANLQFRAPEQARVEAMQERVFELASIFNRDGKARLEVSVFDDTANAVAMDEPLQQALAAAAEAHAPGCWQYMPSGAAHDAQVLAMRMPAAMLFIPSIGGISHDFAEDSHADDIVLGCEVLADAVVSILSRVAAEA